MQESVQPVQPAEVIFDSASDAYKRKPLYLQDPRLSFAVTDGHRTPLAAVPYLMTTPNLYDKPTTIKDRAEYVILPAEEALIQIQAISVVVRNAMYKAIHIDYVQGEGIKPLPILHAENELELAAVATQITDLPVMGIRVYELPLSTVITLDDGDNVLGDELTIRLGDDDRTATMPYVMDVSNRPRDNGIYIGLRGWAVDKRLLMQPPMPPPTDENDEPIPPGQQTIEHIVPMSRLAMREARPE